MLSPGNFSNKKPNFMTNEEWEESLKCVNYIFTNIDRTLSSVATEKLSSDILKKISPLTREESAFKGDLTGHTVRRIGIKTSDKRKKLQRSIAGFGNLFIGSRLGYHTEIEYKGVDTTKFSYKGRIYIVWDVSFSNNYTLLGGFGSGEDKFDNLFIGKYVTYSSERYITGLLSVMMLLRDAIMNDILVNLYVFPRGVVQELKNTIHTSIPDKVKYGRIPDRDGNMIDINFLTDIGGFMGFAPESYYRDASATEVYNDICTWLPFSKVNYVEVERFYNVYGKLCSDIISTNHMKRQTVLYITDIEPLRMNISDNYPAGGYLTEIIDKYADQYWLFVNGDKDNIERSLHETDWFPKRDDGSLYFKYLIVDSNDISDILLKLNNIISI